MEHPLVIEDMVVMLAAAVGDWAHEAGLGSIRDEFWDEMFTFLKTELHPSELKLGFKPLELKYMVRNASPFWKKTRNMLATSLHGLVEKAHAFIKQKVKKIQKANEGKPVVVIFDSLEKLGGSEVSFRDTFESHPAWPVLPGAQLAACSNSYRPSGSLRSNGIADVKEEDLEMLARYMDHHMVLCYQNGGGWYQLHELIRDDVQRRAEHEEKKTNV